MSNGESLTSPSSSLIRVVDWSNPVEPTWFDLVIETERWSGYTFRLTYISGALTTLEVRRGTEAAPLSAHLL